MAEKKQTKKKPAAKKLRIIPIGGLHEIGKNLTVLEYGSDILVIDCGMAFPDEDMYGIDIVIPDFSYLIENADKVRGVFITHAHEDHIGAVPYLLDQLNVPVYGTKLTIGFIRKKLLEFGMGGDLREFTPGDVIKCGCFKVETIHTTHSVADSVAFAIDTPVGKIFHTGDFKVDFTPVDGQPIDLARLAELGREGVLLLMADSTNAMRKGYTPSEAIVGKSLDNIFAATPQRIIIATFSSNVYRVQKIIDLAVKNHRKVAVSGRSMETMVQIAVELGYLKIPANTLVDIKKIKDIPDSKLVVITTGSQGEPMSALARMAYGEHKNVKIRPKDVVVLSSSPVPGNEKSVSNIVNALMEKGADVIYNDIAETHVSGHACQEELKLIHSLIKPKFFMPVHGEFKHLRSHAELAESMGMKEKNILFADNGDVIELTKAKASVSEEKVPAEGILVDGLGVGDVGSSVLNERKILSESGLVVISAGFSNGMVVSGPELYTKGFLYVKEYGEILEYAKQVLSECFMNAESQGITDIQTLKTMATSTLKKFIREKMERTPVILPIFIEF